MEGLLNIGSLILGLIAWVLAVFSIVKYRKDGFRKGIIISSLIMSSCAISILFQILYNDYLVKIEDFTALMDTTGTLVVASSALVIVTITLNGIYLILTKDGGN